MQKLGTISLMQIQRNPLKTGDGEARKYDTAPLLSVSKLKITSKGFYGINEHGEEIVDVHHEEHPRTRFRGDNRLSFGFTHFYDEIRERFGDHMVDGLAGENIIIQTDGQINLPENCRVMLQCKDGTTITLTDVIPAPPCREFSIFCAQKPLGGAELKDTLQFLDHGRRGYYANLQDQNTYLVETGDVLFLVD